ncbi:MAG: hypothetical protein EOO77_10330 [Oxalobacteraceae bacterium]|nr:MAG: hypothetical protein EOO77_10330 [Oxalobacteraceae bacterium]
MPIDEGVDGTDDLKDENHNDTFACEYSPGETLAPDLAISLVVLETGRTLVSSELPIGLAPEFLETHNIVSCFDSDVFSDMSSASPENQTHLQVGSINVSASMRL